MRTRRLLFFLLLVLGSLSTIGATAEPRQYGVKDVPNVRLADARRYVSDPASILTAASRDSIDAVLSRLEAHTGIETAVVMLPSIGDADIFEFAHELFREWGIGKKKSDNGMLILFVMDQHKVRFTTGYGLEGTMTDAMSKRIQTQQMVPRFKQGDWDAGMVDGVRAVAQVLDGTMEPDSDSGDDDDMLIAVITVLAMVLGAILVIWAIGETQRCPKCRKKGVKKMAQHTLRLHGGRRVRRTTYLCPHCGHTFTRDENIDDSGSAAAFVAGSMLGGGRSGGGGSFGGSFGGGSTGGGGSTSSW